MGLAASARASFGIYNSKEDIDILNNAQNVIRYLIIKWTLRNYIKR